MAVAAQVILIPVVIALERNNLMRGSFVTFQKPGGIFRISFIRNQEYMNWDVTCGLFWPSRRNAQCNRLTGCWKWLVPLGNRKTVSGIRNWDGGYCCHAYPLPANASLHPRGRCLHWLPLPLELRNGISGLAAVYFNSPTAGCLGPQPQYASV